MVDCIVLAAGGSSRMGSWKLLLPWKGLTVVEAVVEEALAACDRVIVVAGYRSEDLAVMFAQEPRVTLVENPGWRKGQFSSLRRGVLEVKAEAFFVTLADMPGVNQALFAQLQAARNSAAATERPRAFRPGSPQSPGHPVLFDAGAAVQIAALAPAQSMRDVFPQLELSFVSGSVQAFTDLDVPADYGREAGPGGALDPARTRCPPRLIAEANDAGRRLTTA